MTDIEDNVRIHISISPTARRALRLSAAAHGTTVADLIEHWALSEADGLGLHRAVRRPRPSSPSSSSGGSPTR